MALAVRGSKIIQYNEEKGGSKLDHFFDRIPLFSALTAQEREQLKQKVTERLYTKQSFVFMEGNKCEAVFFIRSGTVKVTKVDEAGNEQGICLLRAGNMFPHVGFFNDSLYPATAEVVEDSKLFVFKMKDFEHFLIENPKAAMKVIKIMSKKMLELQQRLQELISGDVYDRVINLLLRFAKEHGETRGNGIFVSLPITNKEIANMIGTTRESISRTLNYYKKLALIDFDKDGIMIHDLKQLQMLKVNKPH